MPTKNRQRNPKADYVDRKKASKQVEIMQNHYLFNKKMSDLGTHSSFRLFSLDASDLEVLENIENEKKKYDKAKRELINVKKMIAIAKKKMDIDLLEEAKALIDKVCVVRQEVIEEKDELNKSLHNAIKQLEV